MKRPVVLAAIVAVLASTTSFLLRASAPHVPSNAWASTGDMAHGRAGASSVLLYDGRVLVTGGVSDGGVTAAAERYSSTAEAFLETAAMETARANHSSTLLPDGRVLVAGGVGADGGALSAAEIYDPVNNAWTPAPMNYARAGHTATALYDGRILIAGGDAASVPYASLETFDPGTGVFTLAAPVLTIARTGHGASLLYDGRVLITGGFDGTNTLASTNVYDPYEDTISDGPSLATARAGHSATTLLDGKVAVIGGASDSGEVASAEIYDPSTGIFSAASSSLATARQHHQAILLPHNNQVLIVGGTSGGNAVASAEVFVGWQGNGGMFFPTTAPTVGTRAWATASALSQPAALTIRSGPNDGLMMLTGGSASADASHSTVSTELYGFATIKTDEADYPPGTTVTITGGGWVPGETVTLTLLESPLYDTHTLKPVKADASGNIRSTEFKPDADDLGIKFYLTATGSASQAQTSFTDGSLLDQTYGLVTVVVPCNEIDVKWTNPNASNTYGDLYRSEGSTFNQATAIRLAHYEGGPNRFLHKGEQTYKDVNGLVPGHTYSYRFTAGKTNGGGGAATESVTNNGTTLPTSGCLSTTTTTVTASPASISVGATGSIVLTAQVTKSSGIATTAPTGTVHFTVFDAANVTLAEFTGTLNGSGIATATMSASTISGASGTYRVDAQYDGDSWYTGSSGSTNILVGVGSSSTTLASSSNPSTYGDPVILTATVAPGGATGTVSFYDGGTCANPGPQIGTTQSLTGGTANVTTSSLSHTASPHALIACYSGDSNYASSSASLSQIVNARTATATATDGGGVYNGNPYTGSGTCSDSLTPVISYTPGPGAPVNFGTTSFTVTCGDGGINYVNGTATGSIVITKAPVTATAGSGSATFDGATHAPSACAVTGAFTGGLSCVNNPASVGPTAGTTTIVPNVTGTGQDNFAIEVVNGSYSIAAKQATATATNGGGVYSGNGYAGSGTCSDGLTPVISYTPGPGAPVDVGTTSFTVTCGDGGINYVDGTANGSTVITLAPVTATAGSGSTTYDGATHAASACAVTGAYTGALSCTNNPASVGPNAGTTSIAPVVTGTEQANFSITLQNGSCTIAKKPVTATATNGGGVYNANAYNGSGSCSDGLTPVISYTPGPGAPVNVGTTSFTVTCSDGSINYVDDTATGSIAITPAPVTATAGSGSTTYDGATHAPSACAVTGAFTGDLSCVNTPASVGPNVGTTTIAPSVSGTDLDNFAITPANGSYSITAVQATATATDGGGVYNGTPYPGSGTCSNSLTPGITYTPGPGAPVNFGTTSFTVTCGDGGVNYVNGTATGSIVITKAPVTATAGSGSATFDGATHQPSACAVTGAFTGDLSCVNTPASVGPNVGTTTITPSVSGTDLTNFAITPANGSDSITAVQATATATDGGGVYNGTAYPGSGTCSNGLTPGISYTPGPGAPVNFGTTSFTVTCSDGGINYVNGTATGSIAITKAPVTATAGSGSATFDGSTHAPSACTVTGAYTGGLSCVNNPASVGPNVGTTTVTPSVSGAGAANFDITPANGSYSITPAQATATAPNGGGVYNGTAYPGSGTCSNGLTPAISYTPGPGAPVNFGTTSFTVTCGDGGINYVNGTATGSIAITKAPVTATAGSGSAAYDGTTKSPAACAVTGAYKGNLTCGNSPASVGPAAGTTTITPSVSGTGLGNFDVTLVSGSYTIGQASSTVTVTCTSPVTYTGSALAPCTAKATGAGLAVGGVSVTPVTYTNNTNAGTADASATWNGDANHSSSTGTATFTIGKAPSTTVVTFVTGPYSYKASAYTATATVTGAGGLNSPVAVVSTGDCVNVTTTGGCTATATYAGDANHLGSSDTKSITIVKATATITADSKYVTYGDPLPTLTATVTGLKNGDTLNYTLATTALPCTTVGTCSPVGTYPIAVSLGSNPNYNVTIVNGMLSIGTREGIVAYIGQTFFVTSGSSATTAQVTLSASVTDPDLLDHGTVAAATVTFTDLLTGKVLASGVKVSPVANSGTNTGTANTIVTLSTGQYGAQEYLIEVTLAGSYKNTQQTTAAPGSAPYIATHPVVAVAIPATKNTLQGNGTVDHLTTAAGVYGLGTLRSYTAGMAYNNKGTSPQGKIELIIDRPDGTYYIKSSSITSVAFSGPVGGINKDVTIYTKASIYRINGSTTTSIDGGVTLRMDAHDGGATGDTVSLTVLSSKDGSLYYSNNWVYDTATLSYKTVLQSVVSPNFIQIF
jgi:hypothetical protein